MAKKNVTKNEKVEMNMISGTKIMIRIISAFLAVLSIFSMIGIFGQIFSGMLNILQLGVSLLNLAVYIFLFVLSIFLFRLKDWARISAYIIMYLASASGIAYMIMQHAYDVLNIGFTILTLAIAVYLSFSYKVKGVCK